MSDRKYLIGMIVAFFFGLFFATYSESRSYLPYILKGAKVTVEITILSIILCTLTSFVAGLCKLSRNPIISWGATVFVEALRGSSILVYLFWVFFVLPEFGVSLDPITAAVIVIGLNYGAYGAEIVRGSMHGVPIGQHEAAIALSISGWTRMRRIIIPQALLIMVPSLGNLFILLLKGTAIASAITVVDLTYAAVQLNQMHLKTLEIFGLVLMLYYLMAQIIRMSASMMEKHLSRHLLRVL